MLAKLRPLIISTDRPLVLRALAFYRRLKVQVTLRYDDTVHLGPHRCQLSSGGLWALLARAKTSGAGPLPVFAAAFCGVVDSRWLARGWQALLEATPWGRGYLLPGLQGDTATGAFARRFASPSEAAMLRRRVLLELRVPQQSSRRGWRESDSHLPPPRAGDGRLLDGSLRGPRSHMGSPPWESPRPRRRPLGCCSPSRSRG